MKNTEEQTKKKKSPLISILILLGVMVFSAGDMLSEDVLFALIAVVGFAAPVAFVVWLVRTMKKGMDRTGTHTHDRIDHSRDLKVNPSTGKAAPTRTVAVHSPKEHWKEQLDGLLANGTIDRAEYRALMKRKF